MMGKNLRTIVGWADRELAQPGRTMEQGAATDTVPDLEPDQFADGTWIAGERNGAPATVDGDPVPVSFAASFAATIRDAVQRLSPTRAEQPDSWIVTRHALADGEVRRIVSGNPDRVKVELRRVTGSSGSLWVASGEGASRSDHSSLMLAAGDPPFTSEAIGDVWARADGADVVVQVVESHRSGLAVGLAQVHGG